LKKFQKPSDCRNKAELKKLLKAITSGKCKLCKMGNEEWDAWKLQHMAWNFVTRDSEDKDSCSKTLGKHVSSSPALLYSSPDISRCMEPFQSTPLTLPAPMSTSQLSNSIHDACADCTLTTSILLPTSNLHHLLNAMLTGNVEAHGANYNSPDVSIVPSMQALESFTGMYTSQMATCGGGSGAWGHNILYHSLSFFMCHSQIQLLQTPQAPFNCHSQNGLIHCSMSYMILASMRQSNLKKFPN